ncbi:hypothetical protein EAI_14087 [Harpegnathos saltator]|uniref:Uncharacterized protein n=1 Tax=Harpegnathos saltator TaxID=610380 RepID=E2BQV2_HARSA|nr:hypothetical protein EAI_14087 [Harpegnathos saltator]
MSGKVYRIEGDEASNEPSSRLCQSCTRSVYRSYLPSCNLQTLLDLASGLVPSLDVSDIS